jgi:hypothetical protein
MAHVVQFNEVGGPEKLEIAVKQVGEPGEGEVRISANVTADFGNVTDSAGFGIARC